MNGWTLATDVAIWTLILGSLAVFGWFLAEVARLARRRKDPPRGDEGDPPQ